jgi:ATP phosphoribosyltransferase regulatory subunit
MLNNNESERLMLKLPFGFRDIFPVEARERKNIEEIIRKQFESWGYGEIKTPVVEYTENIAFGAGKGWKDKLISFFDTDGNLISMRADMTIPVARVTGMRLKKSQLPARFYYFANSFRQSGAQKGKKRFFNQAGLEFVGTDSISGDIEVLTVLAEIMRRLDIKSFRIALSHTKFLEGMSKWFGLVTSAADFVKKKMIAKDFVGLKDFLEKISKKKSGTFFSLMEPSEDFSLLKSYSDKIENKTASESLIYVAEIYNVLKKLGFAENFMLDLGTVRDFEYYSGLLFEVYSPKISEIIGSGGRYDGLIKKFGLDVAGTGFALDVDLLHKSLERFDVPVNAPEKIVLAGPETEIARLIALSAKLRSGGSVVELMPLTGDDLNKLKKEISADFLYISDFKNESVTIRNLRDKTEKNVKLADLGAGLK